MRTSDNNMESLPLYSSKIQILLFIIGITEVLYIRCQVTIHVEPVIVNVDETVRLTCNYSGTGPESGVKWFRIGDSEGVIYREETAPNCTYFSGGSAYNLTLFTTTCDKTENIYTLSFKVSLSDFGTMWCCSYIIGGDNLCQKNAIISGAITTTSSSTTTTTVESASTTTAPHRSTTALETAKTTHKSEPSEFTQGPTQRSTPGPTPENTPVPLIIGACVGGAVLLIIIIICCCCCPCCLLYSRRKEEKERKYRAQSKQTNHNQDAENLAKSRDETKTPVYGLSNANTINTSQNKITQF